MTKAVLNNGETFGIIRGKINNNFTEVYEGLETLNSGVGSTHIVAKTNTKHTNIQAAIDEAVSGDVVLVYPGTYSENVTLRNGLKVIGIGSVYIDGSITCGDASSNVASITIGSLIVNHANSVLSLENVLISEEVTISAGITKAVNSSIAGNSAFSGGEIAWQGDYDHGNTVVTNDAVVDLHFHAKRMDTNSTPLSVKNTARVKCHWGKTFWIAESPLQRLAVQGRDTSHIEFSCNNLQGSVWSYDSATVIIRNTTAPRGWAYLNCSESSRMEIYNSYFRTDVEAPTGGKHTLEMSLISNEAVYGLQTMKCFNTTFEFTGVDGEFTTMGNLLALYAGDFEAANCTFIQSGDSQNPNPVSGYRALGGIGHGCKFKITNCSFIDNDSFDDSVSLGVGYPPIERCSKHSKEYWGIFENCSFTSARSDKKAISFYSSLTDDGDGVSHFVATDLAVYAAYPGYQGLKLNNLSFTGFNVDALIFAGAGAGETGVREVLFPYWNKQNLFEFGHRRFMDLEIKDGILGTQAFSDGGYGNTKYIKPIALFTTPEVSISDDYKYVVTINYFKSVQDAATVYFSKAKGTMYFTHSANGYKQGYVKELSFYAIGVTASITAVDVLSQLASNVRDPAIVAGVISASSFTFEISHTEPSQSAEMFIDWHDLFNVESITVERVAV